MKDEEFIMKKTDNIKNLIAEAIAISGKYNPNNEVIHFLISEELTIKDFSIETNKFSYKDGIVITVEPYSEGDILDAFADAFIEYFNESSDVEMNAMGWYIATNIVSDCSKKFNKKLAEFFEFTEMLAINKHSWKDGVHIVFDRKNFKVVDIIETKKLYKIIDKNLAVVYVNSSKYDYIIDIAKECKEAIESALNINFKCDLQYKFEIFTERTERKRLDDNWLFEYYKKNLTEESIYKLILSLIDTTKKYKLFGKEAYFRISPELVILSASLKADDVAGNGGCVMPLNTSADRYWEKITEEIIQIVNGTFGLNFRYTHWYEVNNKRYVKKKFNTPDYYRFKIIDFKDLPEDAKAIYFVDSDFTNRTRNLIFNKKGC